MDLKNQKSLIPVDDTVASNPGRVKVNFLVWLRCFPTNFVSFVIGVLFTVGYMIHLGLWKDVTFWVALILVLVFSLAPTLRLRQHFFSGCVNPAIVISTEPNLIAVSTNLANNGSTYLVIKILPHPLHRMRSRPVSCGTRLATVALYSGAGTSGVWEDFDPVAVNCATDDESTIERTLQSIPAQEWLDLEYGLEQLPKPYKPGLYPVLSPPQYISGLN